jgi:predicted GNAT family acetyltransferase
MKYSQYRDPSDFRHVMRPYLERDEAANNLMLGLTEQLADSSLVTDFIPFFATLENRGEIVLAVIQTPPKRIVLYGSDSADRQAFAALSSHLMDSNPVLPGVIGPSAAATAFQEIWSAQKPCRSFPAMKQRIYKTRQVDVPQGIPGHLRLATVEELSLVSRWNVNFMDSIGEPIDFEESVRRAKSRISRKDLYVWENQGVVSMATKTRPTRSGIIISGVYTPPDQRRKGYATACVAALTRALLESGYHFCCLFADLANPVSNRIYRRIGYQPVCDFMTYDFA